MVVWQALRGSHLFVMVVWIAACMIGLSGCATAGRHETSVPRVAGLPQGAHVDPIQSTLSRRSSA